MSPAATESRWSRTERSLVAGFHTTLSVAIPDARTSRARGSTRRLGYDSHASIQYKLLTIYLEGARSIYIRQGQGKTDMDLPSIMVSIKP